MKIVVFVLGLIAFTCAQSNPASLGLKLEDEILKPTVVINGDEMLRAYRHIVDASHRSFKCAEIIDHNIAVGGIVLNATLQQLAIDCILDSNGGENFKFSSPLGETAFGIESFLNFTIAQAAQFGGDSHRFFYEYRLVEMDVEGPEITGIIWFTGGIKATSEAFGIFPLPPGQRFEFINYSANKFRCQHGANPRCKIVEINIVFRHGPNPVATLQGP